MLITATISRNLRDTNTSAPKVLLRNLETNDGPYRDHAWVELNDQLVKLLRSKRFHNNRSHTVQLKADEKVYHYRGTEFKRTLQNIQLNKLL